MQNPAPPGTIPCEVVAATGAIYGVKDAGRTWYFHPKKVLAEHGIVESSLEKGFYKLYWEGRLGMLIHTHVDDMLVAFRDDSSKARVVIESLKKKLYLQSGVRDEFEYLSRLIQVTRSDLRITQPKSARPIELINVTAERKRTPDELVSEEERSEMISLT